MFTVLKPGQLTSVQDLGRTGYRAFGMPVAGVMDRYAYNISNILVGNKTGAAVLEMTLVGGLFKFHSEAYLAVCGADMRGRLNGKEIRNWSAFHVPANSELSFEYASCGCRGYLAFYGGISVPVVLGSRSTYARAKIGGYEGRSLKAGDILETGSIDAVPRGNKYLSQLSIPVYNNEVRLRVIPGPQDDMFTETGLTTFFSSGYTVSSRNDRMGYHFEGPRVQHKEGADIISDSLCQGAIQIPGNGMPIIMMADCQTTGGYAKLGTVIGPDLSKLAQAKRGDKINFELCSDAEAVAVLLAERKCYEKAFVGSCYNINNLKFKFDPAPGFPSLRRSSVNLPATL